MDPTGMESLGGGVRFWALRGGGGSVNLIQPVRPCMIESRIVKYLEVLMK